MDRQKLVIVCLVVLAMAFVVALAVGLGNRDSGNAARPPSLVAALEGLKGKRFLRQEPPTTTTCGGDATSASFTGACTITVPRSGLLSRPTRAVLRVAAGQVVFSLDPEDGPTQSKTLNPGKCVEAVVSRDGGTISFTCATGCSVVLLQQECP